MPPRVMNILQASPTDPLRNFGLWFISPCNAISKFSKLCSKNIKKLSSIDIGHKSRKNEPGRHQRDIRGSVTDIPRDRRTDRPTDGQTVPLIEMR